MEPANKGTWFDTKCQAATEDEIKACRKMQQGYLVWFGLVYSCSIDLQQALTSAVRYRTSQMVEVHQCIPTCFTVT